MNIPDGIEPSGTIDTISTSKSKPKEFWFDCESTGRNPQIAEITQIAGYLCGEEFNIKCRPTGPIEDGALKAQNRTLDDVMSYPEPQQGFYSFIELCGRHINAFDKNDKADLFAYNSSFDLDLLHGFFNRYSPPGKDGFRKYNVGNYFIQPGVCVMQMYRLAVYLGRIDRPKDYKLGSVATKHGIDFKAHDALEDVKAMQKVYQILLEVF